MWTKGYHSNFLVVKIYQSGRRGFFIPVPIFIFEQLLDAAEDLLWLSECIVPRWYHRAACFGNAQEGRMMSPYTMVRMCDELLFQLRKYGKLTLVEVDAEDANVRIDLW